jgi:hypothetical protein
MDLAVARAGARIERLVVPATGPLRLDRGLRLSDTRPSLSLVRACRGRRLVVVAAPGERVSVGSRRVVGAAELRHRDHLFVGDGVEGIVSLDALPARIAQPPDAACPVCLELFDARERAARRCPRCGSVACEACWRSSATGECAVPDCGQPAAFDRPLWSPQPADFVLGCGEEEAP